MASFWDNLIAGRCSVTAITDDRWPIARFLDVRRGQPGKTYTFAAGTIERVWDFDPAAFGISPREAVQLDPQQRLALQLAWEALEDALIPATRLARRNVGVYAGASALDYSTTRMFDSANADAYFMIGNTLSLISNRVSHAFDLCGPSLTIDTACSSSLVALHHAVEALEAGHIEMAIVLGVNLLLSPFPFIGFAQASMLSPDGLCRSFDSRANGYVRAEGGVALVLARSDQTLVDTPRNYARVVGTGTNSDGRTIGVSLPSAESQANLIEAVYTSSGVSPDALAFAEAHGTGTRVGDPIEAQALGRVLGQKRTRPLAIGSVKSNIGHLEPASGLAGLLKAMLALEHDLLPATLHVEQPNPDIPFGELNLAIAHAPVPLERNGIPRAAAVSNFGFGGTNAHVIIADPAPCAASRKPAKRRSARSADRTSANAISPGRGLIVLSAATEAALRGLARAHLESHSGGATDPRELAAALGHFRDLLPERAALLASTGEELSRGLSALAEGAQLATVVRGRAVARDAKVAFVFSGNGSQWAGMGKVALSTNACFRAKLEEIDEIFARHADWSLIEALGSGHLAQQLKSTSVAQPLLFAIQVAICAALAEGGLEPDLVLGHSVGEVAAAQVAGVLSLETAVALIVARSTHQEVARGHGAMAALRLGEESARASIASSGLSDIEIAAVNSPRSVTIVGSHESIAAYAAMVSRQGIGCKVLDLDYPFHSRYLAPAEKPLEAALKNVRAKAGRIPFISTVTGERVAGPELSGRYWWHNVRDPVRFAAGVALARQDGAQLFVEIGPRAILRGYLNECLGEASGGKTATIPSLDTGDSGQIDPIRRTLAVAITRGAKVDPDKAFGPRPVRPVRLPGYAWQNATYRLDASVEALGGLMTRQPHHPLLGWQGIPQDPAWHVHIDAENLPWLQDHRVNGQIVFPGAGFAEIALAAARQWLGDGRIELRDMSIVAPLVLHPGESTEMRTLLSPDTSTLEIASRPRLGDQAFQVHAYCRFAKLPSYAAPQLAIEADASGRTLDAEAVYRAATALGLDYGPAFRRVALARRVDTSRIVMTFDPRPAAEKASHPFGLDPTDLDAAFHGLFALSSDAAEDVGKRVPLVPIRLGRLCLHMPGRRATQAELVVRRANRRSAQADLLLFDEGRNCIASLEDVRFAALRLTPELKLADVAYHEACAPLARDDKPAAGNIREQIEDLADVLARSASETVGGDEPRLLLEAAARRIAYDTVARHAGETGRMALSATNPAQDARDVLLRSLLMVLETGGLAEERADEWQLLPCSLPPVSDLLRTVLTEHPAWSADCVLLNRAISLIDARLESDIGTELYSAATISHFWAASPRFARAKTALREAVATLVRRKPKGRSLRLCVLGLQDGLARQLVDVCDAGTCGFVLTDADARLVERGQLRYARHPNVEVLDLATALGEHEHRAPYDLAVAAFALSRMPSPDHVAELAGRLRPGGALLAIEAAPDAFHDVVFGLDPGWFSRSVGSAFPIGLLRTAEEWGSELSRAGYSDARCVKLGQDGTDATLLMAGSPSARDRLAADIKTAAAHHRAVAPITIIPPASPAGDALARELGQKLSAHGRSPTSRHAHNGNGAKMRNGNGHGAHNGHGASNGLHEVSSDAGRPSAPPELVWIAAPTNGACSSELGELLAMLAKFFARAESTAARLWIIAPGGARAHADLGTAVPSAAGLWAAARTATNEYADTDIRLIDIAEGLAAGEAAKRLAALIADPPEDRELIVTPDGTLALRVQRGLSPGGHGRAGPKPATEVRAVLAQASQGSLESLEWRREPLSPAGPNAVSVEVSATGLNFRDVMWGLGLLPEEALEAGFAGPTLGFECAGIVTSVGSAVTHLRPGQRVIALAPQAFASHVTVAAHAVLPLPDGVDLEAAASIPVAFLTAYYALHHLARVEKDEWVLIHGGAGGVGLAALQVARWRGAKVIATAGSEEKRDILRLLGADHVLSSRSLEFVDRLRAITGDGVDVVLNSLSGEAMERSLELLKPFGRFLELGKRDFYANTKIGLRPFRQNASYFGIDADQLLGQQPALAARLMHELMQHFADRTFAPLAHRIFDGTEIVDAFRLMQQSGHIGKIVVRPPVPSSLPDRNRGCRFAVDAEGAHVIIGGLGGFGLATAGWLADRGAKTIVLVGRSSVSEGAASAAIEELRRRGVDVRSERCDAADPASLDRLLAALRARMPIKGVVHAAMVLDDALIRNLDTARIARVLRAKIDIGLNLDRLTQNDDLDYFWLYSSITTMIGNPGQSAYVAGNSALEALARTRRAAGRPALAIRWGAIEDAGVLARERSKIADLARRAGASAFKARDALDLLEQAIAGDDGSRAGAVVTLAAMNWSEARSQLTLLRTPLFSDLRGIADSTPTLAVDLSEAIKTLDDGAARDLVARHLAGELSAILRMPADDLNWQRPLAELGLDSLMAVELRLAATRRLGVELPLSSIADGASISSVAEKVVARLRSNRTAGDGNLMADQELAEKHLDVQLDGEQLERIRREVGERAAVSDRVIS